jgi:hypothetical protein
LPVYSGQCRQGRSFCFLAARSVTRGEMRQKLAAAMLRQSVLRKAAKKQKE